MRTTGDLHLSLPCADRLDEDEVGAHCIEDSYRIERRQGKTARMASGGHRPNEDPGIHPRIRHADSVSEDRAARVRRGRVDGDDPDALATRAECPDQAIDQGTLTDPRWPREAHDVRTARVRIDPREGLDGLRFVVLDQRDELSR